MLFSFLFTDTLCLTNICVLALSATPTSLLDLHILRVKNSKKSNKYNNGACKGVMVMTLIIPIYVFYTNEYYCTIKSIHFHTPMISGVNSLLYKNTLRMLLLFKLLTEHSMQSTLQKYTVVRRGGGEIIILEEVSPKYFTQDSIHFPSETFQLRYNYYVKYSYTCELMCY